MDVFQSLVGPGLSPISCVDMHTCGEPTRIVIKGYPELHGTLLEQRAQAKMRHDHIRQRLLQEPRGHFDMYGAILRRETEHTRDNTADIGVLFATNDGYSTMCGHATIALGRFLVDTQDLEVFPNRTRLVFDQLSSSVRLKSHAPCGVINLTIPTDANGSKSDPSRPVSFTSIACFATGLDIQVPITNLDRWPELESRSYITANFAYGGAFYCFVNADELGFKGGLKDFDLELMNRATKLLKHAINNDKSLKYLFSHPDADDLSFLYSVIVVDKSLGEPLGASVGAETGLCFFSDQQVDRSPTGSAVSARLAVAYAAGRLGLQQPWTYHSLVSLNRDKRGAFAGRVISADNSQNAKYPIIRTQVEGSAFYTGAHTFVLEKEDSLGEGGFFMQCLAAQ